VKYSLSPKHQEVLLTINKKVIYNEIATQLNKIKNKTKEIEKEIDFLNKNQIEGDLFITKMEEFKIEVESKIFDIEEKYELLNQELGEIKVLFNEDKLFDNVDSFFKTIYNFIILVDEVQKKNKEDAERKFKRKENFDKNHSFRSSTSASLSNGMDLMFSSLKNGQFDKFFNKN
jgi:hypothetical protein